MRPLSQIRSSDQHPLRYLLATRLDLSVCKLTIGTSLTGWLRHPSRTCQPKAQLSLALRGNLVTGALSAVLLDIPKGYPLLERMRIESRLLTIRI